VKNHLYSSPTRAQGGEEAQDLVSARPTTSLPERALLEQHRSLQEAMAPLAECCSEHWRIDVRSESRGSSMKESAWLALRDHPAYWLPVRVE